MIIQVQQASNIISWYKMHLLDKFPVTFNLKNREHTDDLHIYPSLQGNLMSWKSLLNNDDAFKISRSRLMRKSRMGLQTAEMTVPEFGSRDFNT